jgi:hypothetical protein
MPRIFFFWNSTSHFRGHGYRPVFRIVGQLSPACRILTLWLLKPRFITTFQSSISISPKLSPDFRDCHYNFMYIRATLWAYLTIFDFVTITVFYERCCVRNCGLKWLGIKCLIGNTSEFPQIVRERHALLERAYTRIENPSLTFNYLCWFA